MPTTAPDCTVEETGLLLVCLLPREDVAALLTLNN
jgi:hypothetical protein